MDLPHLTFTKKLKSHSKVVHILVVFSCILLSSLGPIGALAKYTYIATNVPTLLCTPNNTDYILYSLILPCIILVGVSASFLVLLFWAIYKVCMHVYVHKSTICQKASIQCIDNYSACKHSPISKHNCKLYAICSNLIC